MFVSDDDHVPEYAVHQDNKTELEMIGVADERNKQRRCACRLLEPRKERLRELTSAAQDIATEKIAW